MTYIAAQQLLLEVYIYINGWDSIDSFQIFSQKNMVAGHEVQEKENNFPILCDIEHSKAILASPNYLLHSGCKCMHVALFNFTRA